ncbi:MAG: phage tail sheath subtilisin-like domain-containing protein [Oscillospiraceae bacterium]|jgi:phage tail sheath protein FI|nr:phage tail sheath subtilisin-like domain-containing protein [Oscillospiraceae bacterium]
MPEYLSPGVYVEEFESGAVPMESVGTSTAGFIGLAERGPVVGKPQLVTSFSDFMRNYGGHLSETKYGAYRYLPFAVEHFFINGGARAFIMRVAPEDAKTAEGKAPQILAFKAANPGEWGNSIKVAISNESKQKTQIMEATGNDAILKNVAGFYVGDVVEFFDGRASSYATINAISDKTVTFDTAVPQSCVDKGLVPTKFVKSCEVSIVVRYGDAAEEYPFVTFNTESPDYVLSRMSKSELVKVEILAAVAAAPKAEAKKDDKAKADKADEAEAASAPAAGNAASPFNFIGGTGALINIALEGGNDGAIGAISAGDFIGTDGGPGKRTGIQAFIESSGVSIMAVPGVTIPDVSLSLVAHCENQKSAFAVLDMPRDRKKPDEMLEYRDMFDSSYAAVYHPWIEANDPLAKKSIYIPPSGSMIGIYARSDIAIGVHKAPANEVVRACTGLEYSFNTGEQDLLNPKGVNVIRAFPGRGIRVWGARTLSSNASWKYINVRRLFIFLEESIKENTNWVVFEPNTEVLWSRVRRSIEMFLTTVWRSGALFGSTPDEAFFVDIGRSTMTQDDIDNGRLICVIGVAPVKPAEFVIFRISQYTANAQ